MSSSDESDKDEGEHSVLCGICCTCVPTGSVGVVQNLGRYSGFVNPGLTIYCPVTHEITTVSLALKQINCTTSCKTKDNVTLEIATAVQYRINKDMVRAAVFEIENPVKVIEAQIDNMVRSTLPYMDLDEAYSNKDDICNDILRSVRVSMAKYGYNIESVLVTDLKPERSVLQAMNQINAARRNREAATEEAEAAKILQVKGAEAEAEAKYLSGMGVARMRKAMAEGIQESMQTMSQGGLTPQEAMHMMVQTQYLDTLKDFANSNSQSSIMVPTGPGAAAEIEAQVRAGFLPVASSAPAQTRMS
mmetsp:Transcript_21538/g.64284  ORF Transcript_21538/g.64284 Transcript_21538/m.64284 type:complete len:304 (-) Transcript_21538:60-971(-)